MVSFNKVILAGNLTRDPELRYTPGGAAVAEFAIAINRKWNGKDGEAKEEVGFFDCVVWARGAEVITQYVKKGDPLLIEGYLQQDRWEDATSGQKRSKVKVTVERFQFLGGKKGADSSGAPAEEAPAPEANPFA